MAVSRTDAVTTMARRASANSYAPVPADEATGLAEESSATAREDRDDFRAGRRGTPLDASRPGHRDVLVITYRHQA